MPTKEQTKNYLKFNLGPPWDFKRVIRGVLYIPKEEKKDLNIKKITLIVDLEKCETHLLSWKEEK